MFGAGETSSKSTSAVGGKLHQTQHLLRWKRVRDFIHLILSYPMRIGYEDILKRFIQEVDRQCYFYTTHFDAWGIEEILEQDETLRSEVETLRYVQALVPRDITEEIINGGGGSVKHVPHPILLLATHLALRQLTHTITSRAYKTKKIWFSARDDAEKITVMEHIQANSRISEAFYDLKIIDFNQIDETKMKEEVLMVAECLRRNTKLLVLLVDGDGDKKIIPHMAILPIQRDSKNVMVFITSLSPNDELSEKVQLRIRTEDHLLPWEVFRKNVGSELLDSSTTIQEIAVRIVERCGGHLLAINLMAKSLKGVKDVHVWELALEKLCYRDREAIVNAFLFNIIWANAIPKREMFLLLRCLMVIKHRYLRKIAYPVWVSEDQLFARWFYEKLVDTNEEAKKILQNFMECSILMQFEDIQGRRILVPVDIETILHTLGEGIPEKLADGALASTISELQVLNLSYTHLWNLYYCHTALNLEGCMLETLPEAIFKLENLETLLLEHCSQLRELPQQISELQSLETLSLEWCKRLETLPQEIGKLQKLKTLKLGHCSQLLELPQQITQLENLETLSLAWCKRLETLPQDIGKPRNLRNLDLRGTSLLQINENQEFINSDYRPLSPPRYHELGNHSDWFDIKIHSPWRI